MADETNIAPAADIASVDASAKAKEKKTRAPRKPKAAPEAISGSSVSAPAKKTRAPRKKAASASEAVVAAPAAKTPASAKKAAPVAKSQPAKRAPRSTVAAASNADGFSDLLKLEKENQKLRKSRSDKLRAENADLRKKLGLS